MKDTEIILPENWNEVTLSQFQEIQQLDKKSPEYDAQLISVLTDIDPDVIGRYDLQTYAKILMALSFMVKLPNSAEYKPIIKVKGNEYGLVKFSEFTNGEWFSLETWLEDANKNLHKIMAMIYRPLITAINDDYRITEPYDSKSAEQRSELFKAVPISECYGAILFFSITEKQSMQTMKEYLEVKIVMEMMPGILRKWMTRRSLTKFKAEGIRGLPFSILWQKVIYSRLKKSLV